ncbi:hypothetical protein GCM10027294_07210 [Marinactinospora endophytica]
MRIPAPACPAGRGLNAWIRTYDPDLMVQIWEASVEALVAHTKACTGCAAAVTAAVARATNAVP